jgi:lysophospholipid acyltransferase
LLYRIIYFQFCGFVERCKYYAIWTLTEGASILTGLGFTGFGPSGNSLWEGAANVKMLEIEIPSNFKVVVDSWNMRTNVWLRECVYKRVTPKGKKPGFRSSMMTFATSAFWHGIASGYYLTFFFGGFVTSAGRLVRANVRPLVLPAPGAPPTLAKRVYDIVGTVVCILLLNYTAAPFMLLGIKESLLAWQRLGWHGTWMIGGTFVFFYAGGQRMLKGMQQMRLKAEKPVSGATTPDGNMMLPPAIEMVPLQK